MRTRTRSAWLIAECLALMMAQAAFVSAYGKDNIQTHGQLSPDDYKFARQAAHGGIMEVTLGKMAAAQSRNPDVQQFGQRMVTDHSKANEQLKQIATQKTATLPAEPTADQQKEIDRLSKLSGAEFDHAYVPLMVRDHKADVKEFKKASEKVSDTELKGFAASTLPTLEEHLKLAENLKESIRHEFSRNK